MFISTYKKIIYLEYLYTTHYEDVMVHFLHFHQLYLLRLLEKLVLLTYYK